MPWKVKDADGAVLASFAGPRAEEQAHEAAAVLWSDYGPGLQVGEFPEFEPEGA